MCPSLWEMEARELCQMHVWFLGGGPAGRGSLSVDRFPLTQDEATLEQDESLWTNRKLLTSRALHPRNAGEAWQHPGAKGGAG